LLYAAFMDRRAESVTGVCQLGSPFWYYKLGEWKTYKSTGKKLKNEATKVAMDATGEPEAHAQGPVLRKNAKA